MFGRNLCYIVYEKFINEKNRSIFLRIIPLSQVKMISIKGFNQNILFYKYVQGLGVPGSKMELKLTRNFQILSNF